jgi:hypothetical protein
MHHLSWPKHQRWSGQYEHGTKRAAAKRAIARELNIDRRKVKQIIERAA